MKVRIEVALEIEESTLKEMKEWASYKEVDLNDVILDLVERKYQEVADEAHEYGYSCSPEFYTQDIQLGEM